MLILNYSLRRRTLSKVQSSRLILLTLSAGYRRSYTVRHLCALPSNPYTDPEAAVLQKHPGSPATAV